MKKQQLVRLLVNVNLMLVMLRMTYSKIAQDV